MSSSSRNTTNGSKPLLDLRFAQKGPLDGLISLLSRPDPHGGFHRKDEDLAVVDLAASGPPEDGLYSRLHSPIGDHVFDLDLRDEVDGMLGPPILLLVALLPSESADFAHRHALDPRLGQGRLDIFQPVLLDDGFDLPPVCLLASFAFTTRSRSGTPQAR